MTAVTDCSSLLQSMRLSLATFALPVDTIHITQKEDPLLYGLRHPVQTLPSSPHASTFWLGTLPAPVCLSHSQMLQWHSDYNCFCLSVFALKHEWKMVVTLHKPRSRPCSSFKARTCKMLVHLCPDSHATTRGDRIGQHFPWALLKTRSQLMGNCFRYVVAAMTLGEKWQRGWGSWYVVKTQVKLTLTGKDCQLEKGNSCLSKMVQKEHF